MIFRFALAAATLTACAAPPVDMPAATAAACDLKVEFASIGTGIDGAVLEKVDTLLSGDKGVAAINRQRWGKEGEVTLCIDTRAKADATRLFGQIKALFPASSEKPLSVETAAGQHYRVPAP